MHVCDSSAQFRDTLVMRNTSLKLVSCEEAHW